MTGSAHGVNGEGRRRLWPFIRLCWVACVADHMPNVETRLATPWEIARRRWLSRCNDVAHISEDGVDTGLVPRADISQSIPLSKYRSHYLSACWFHYDNHRGSLYRSIYLSIPSIPLFIDLTTYPSGQPSGQYYSVRISINLMIYRSIALSTF